MVWWYRFSGKPPARAALFDDDYQPTPAYYALRAVLERAGTLGQSVLAS